jgi:glycosyltransferase involved in cell wall biosynthesis
MRIAQIAPLSESVPPKLYGGTERVVHWLTNELIAGGHEVTLFASGDSKTIAKLVPVIPQALRLGRPRMDPIAAQALLLEAVARRCHQFDVLHFHIDWVHLPLLSRMPIRFVTTLHGRLDLPGLKAIAGQFPDAAFVSISNNQRHPLPDLRWVRTIYHGLPHKDLQASTRPGRYLAFLGRLTVEKGPEDAIRIAKAARMPLRIAAKIPRGEQRYFNEKLKPLIDGEQIQLVGEVDDRRKQDFLSGASALLFPIDWPEPFGLVMIEAMACGTPVIAYRSGSSPEVIDHGITGFVVEDETDAVRAIRHLDQLDRQQVRKQFEKRFTAQRMTREYLEVYNGLLNGPAELEEAQHLRSEPDEGPGDIHGANGRT